MKSKTLLLLASLTLVVLGLAAWAVKSNPASATSGTTERLRLWPGLLERLDEVAGLEVEREGVVVRIARSDDGWGLADRHGFPVQFERVKENLVAVAELEIIEARTARSENHASLGLAPPEEEGSTATRVALTDESGGELAVVLVGNQKFGRRPSVFVRRQGEDQTYLGRARFNLMGDESSWVQKDLVKLDRARVSEAVLTGAEGATLRVFRETAEETSFQLADLPDGRELKYTGAANPAGMLLNSLRHEDFAPISEVDLEAAPGASAVYRTFDGLIVSIRSTELPTSETPDETATWVAIEASASEESALEVAQEVVELNAFLSAWVFKLPAYQASNLTKGIEEYLAELPEPEPLPEPLPEPVPEIGPPSSEPELEPTPAPADSSLPGAPDSADEADASDG